MTTDKKPKAGTTRVLDMRYLEGTIGYSIRRAQMAVFQSIYKAFGDQALTLVQFSVMAVTADNPEITQAELAEILAVERPRIVPLLNKLEELGLAQRLVCDADKRNRRIVLTTKGHKLLAELKRRFAEHERQLDAHMGSDKARLLRMLHRLSSVSAVVKSSELA
ncbi:MAG TPA: MarR family transcriptional regulator [Burkholderiaceae bacterium]|nr:MarR family transcriptional regulator [Burkholderiaceae bacterium]